MSSSKVPTEILSAHKMHDLLKASGHKFDARFLKEDFQRNELEQLFKRPPVVSRKRYLRIVAEPRSFQVDIAFLPKTWRNANGGVYRMLVIIDIPSRRAFAYPLRSATMGEIVECMYDFHKVVGHILRISADDGFNNATFRAWCSKAKCDLYTDVAADDHAAGGGNKLGIVDRFCRTLKLLIRRWVIANDDAKWTAALPDILRLYNATPHSGIGNRKPLELWSDKAAQMQRYFEDMRYNRSKEGANIPVGTKVRLYEPRQLFGKESYNYSRDLYTVADTDHHRYILDDPQGNRMRRRVKPHELQVVDEASLRPLKRGNTQAIEKRQAHIDRVVGEGIANEAVATEHVDALAAPPKPRVARTRKAPTEWWKAIPTAASHVPTGLPPTRESVEPDPSVRRSTRERKAPGEWWAHT